MNTKDNPASGSNRPTLYSYLRFSTPEQKHGDSIRRQLDYARKIASERGYDLDEKLRLRDDGVSAHRGDHRRRGALGQFLRMIKEGRIKRGSALFVEALDRLTRERTTVALRETILEIIAAGVKIITIKCEYSEETLNTGGMYGLIAALDEAHSSSEWKSFRIRDAWKDKKRRARERKEIATARGPHWLRSVPGGHEVIPEAAETIRMIFGWLGTYGITSIVRKLNVEAPWRPLGRAGKRECGWRTSYLTRLVCNRALIGEYQPCSKQSGGKRVPDGDPIKGYYPAAIDEVTFLVGQSKLAERKKFVRGGPAKNVFNLFTGLGRCGYCGGSMFRLNKGANKRGYRYAYYVCEKGNRSHGCSSNSINYEEFQDLLLEGCSRIDPSRILAPSKKSVSRKLVLRKQLEEKKARVTELARKNISLLNLIDDPQNGAANGIIKAKIAENEELRLELAKEVALLEAQLSQQANTHDSVKRWQGRIRGLIAAIKRPDASELRLHLASHLREFISKIEVFGRGCLEPDGRDFHPLQRLKDYYTSVAETCGGYSSEFLEYLGRQLRTKRGRYLLVHFVDGDSCVYVPANSLTIGFGKSSDASIQRTTPDLDRLWKEFCIERPPAGGGAVKRLCLPGATLGPARS